MLWGSDLLEKKRAAVSQAWKLNFGELKENRYRRKKPLIFVGLIYEFL